MTASATLRAALEKHGVSYLLEDDDWTLMARGAILEAMAQHRNDTLDEVDQYVKKLGQLHFKMGHRVTRAIRKKLAALKSLRAGGE